MKTVMVLLNGFGVEHKASYSIYSEELMPNLDKLTKKYMFSQLRASVHNYRDGYRDLSLEINEMYNYSIYKDEYQKNNILTNTTYLNLKKDLETQKGKLHIFCLIDNSDKVVEQLKNVVKNLNSLRDKTIYLHIVLTSNSIEDYNKILNILSKINVELVEFAKIGLVMGLSSLSNTSPVTEFDFFIRILISEVAEKWQSFSQKLDVCYNMKQLPSLVKPFVVNDGFSIKKDDIFMFWNYDQIDLTRVVDSLKQIRYGDVTNQFKIYSLFEITAKEKVEHILSYHPATNSLASNLERISAKALIMAKKKQINVINYYANGLQSINNPLINFIEVDDYLFKPRELLSIIDRYDHDLMIINYDIEDPKNIEELKFLLHNIDIMIGNIYENSKDSKYRLIISSLYGINKIMNNDKGEICNVIFNQKLPFVFIDNFVTKKNFLAEEGMISNLLPVCYKLMDSKYQGHSIIVKKNALYKLLFK